MFIGMLLSVMQSVCRGSAGAGWDIADVEALVSNFLVVFDFPLSCPTISAMLHSFGTGLLGQT